VKGTSGVYCLQFDAEKIIAGFRNGQIKVYNLITQIHMQTMNDHVDSVTCLQFDTEKLITGSKDKSLIVWKASNGEYIQISKLTFHTDRVVNLKFSGNMLISCSFGRSILVYDITDLENVRLVKNLAQDEPRLVGFNLTCNAVDLTEDYFLAGVSNEIGIWNKRDANLPFVDMLEGHTQFVSCITTINSWAISGSDDMKV